jgi:hypothetical protein
MTRREMLGATALGFGSLALSALDSGGAPPLGSAPGGDDLRPRHPHHSPRARAVIFLTQNGGPSPMDLFDPKPELNRFDGHQHGEQVEMFTKGSEANRLLGSPFRFLARGQCGMELSEVIPHLGSVADDFTLVRSMVSEHNNHTEGLVLLNTGKIFPGRPALGSWVTYALGSENRNMPGYVVLRDPAGYNTSGTLLWQNGWLPAQFGGTEFSTVGAPVQNLNPPWPRAEAARRAQLDLLAKLNRAHQQRHPGESALEARIQNHELAARLQLEATNLFNLAGESEATKNLYGLDHARTKGYGLRLLLARRLVEAGVRFVQVFPPLKPDFQPWDSHFNIHSQLQEVCGHTDQPSAALIKDLKQRGLLDSTLVIWSGEFGRLPVSQNGTGRDHNRNGFSLVLAGGGFKSGHVHGATDDVGYRAVQDKVTVHDLHATILHQLGLDHDRLAYSHQGRSETLTDASVSKARVVRELLHAPAGS